VRLEVDQRRRKHERPDRDGDRRRRRQPDRREAGLPQRGCRDCHTLKAAGTNGTVGPNLDERKPSIDKVVERVTNGKGVMPSFKGRLTPFQIKSVAAFVYASTH
jgi:mono/diheme cytochrome c family protein